jgi:hypothetical protein
MQLRESRHPPKRLQDEFLPSPHKGTTSTSNRKKSTKNAKDDEELDVKPIKPLGNPHHRPQDLHRQSLNNQIPGSEGAIYSGGNCGVTQVSSAKDNTRVPESSAEQPSLQHDTNMDVDDTLGYWEDDDDFKLDDDFDDSSTNPKAEEKSDQEIGFNNLQPNSEKENIQHQELGVGPDRPHPENDSNMYPGNFTNNPETWESEVPSSSFSLTCHR